MVLGFLLVLSAVAGEWNVGEPREMAPTTLRLGPADVEVVSGVVAPVKLVDRTVAIAFEGEARLSYTFRQRGPAQAVANWNVLMADGAVDTWAPVAHQEGPMVTGVDRFIAFLPEDQLDGLLGGEPASGSFAWVDNRLTKVDRCLNFSVPIVDVHTDVLLAPAREILAGRRGDWLTLDGWPRSIGAPIAYMLEDGCAVLDHDPVRLARNPDLGRLDVELDVRRSAVGRDVVVQATSVFTLDSWGDNQVRIYAPTGSRITEVEVAGSSSAPIIDGNGVARIRVDPETEQVVIVRSEGVFGITGDRVSNEAATRTHRVVPWLDRAGVWSGVMQTRTHDGLTTAQAGPTMSDEEEQGVRIVRSDISGLASEAISVAVGEWVTAHENPVGNLPAVRAHVFRDERISLKDWGPLTRQIVAYYEQLLPPIPVREIEIYQTTTSGTHQLTFTAMPGLIRVQQLSAYAGGSGGSGVEHILAHEVAHQWWGNRIRPATLADGWMSETMAEVYECAYVGASMGPKRCTRELRHQRRQWENLARPRIVPPPAMTGRNDDDFARKVLYEHGPVLFDGYLKAWLGPDGFYGSLDQFARAHELRYAETDALGRTFTKVTGQDVSAWMDTWVYGAILPKITLHRGSERSRVTVDVPFGVYHIPIEVTGADKQKQLLWVRVVDGTGEIAHPGAVKVKLDPRRLVPALSRSTVRE